MQSWQTPLQKTLEQDKYIDVHVKNTSSNYERKQWKKNVHIETHGVFSVISRNINKHTETHSNICKYSEIYVFLQVLIEAKYWEITVYIPWESSAKKYVHIETY